MGAGDWTSQKFLGSMEGAILGGKLAAEVVSERAIGVEISNLHKEIHSSVLAKQTSWQPKDPTGVIGDGPIAWGGGSDNNAGARKQLETSAPSQLVKHI